MTLTTAISRLQFHALACTGVKAAPDNPPDNISVFPFAFAYPERGDLMAEAADQARDIHTVIVEFHVNRTLLNAAVNTAKGYIEEYAHKLVNDPTLNGTVSTILFGERQHITYEFGRLEWNTVQTIGVRFHVPIKVRTAV